MQYTIRQVLDEVFADKDSRYGPEWEALMAKFRWKLVQDRQEYLLHALGDVQIWVEHPCILSWTAKGA